MELQKHQKFNFNVRFYLVANLYFFFEDIIYERLWTQKRRTRNLSKFLEQSL